MVGERVRPFGPPSAFDPSTSTLIFGENDAVLVDTLTTVAEAEALANWVALHHRNLTTIYITHGHPDHFIGLSVLLQRFPEARAIATPQSVELMRKYSEAMKCTVLDANGKAVQPAMGCYGIGVSRIVAAAIEQNFDDNGIRWPVPMAPWRASMRRPRMLPSGGSGMFANLRPRCRSEAWMKRKAAMTKSSSDLSRRAGPSPPPPSSGWPAAT